MRHVLVRMRALVGIMMLCACSIVAAQSSRAGLRIVVIDGDEAANIVAEKMAAEPVIEVRDREDRRVAGAVVRFGIKRTLRNRLPAVFRDGRSEVRTLTDATGRARTAAVTPLEPGSYEIDVEVSYQGETATTTMRQTNYATAAEARADGRQPVQNSGLNAGVTGGATASGGAGGGATASVPAGGAAPAAIGSASGVVAGGGGGVSHGLIAGLAAAGGGVGAAVALSHRNAEAPVVARVTSVDATVSLGIQEVTPFTFTAVTNGFEAGPLTYSWEFGDGSRSTEASPTHVYVSSGAYTVVTNVSNAKQSARSEAHVTVVSLSGNWFNGFWGGGTTLSLTQAGTRITGNELGGGGAVSCPVSGSLQVTSPQVVINRPLCPQPGFLPLAAGEYRLDMTAGGTELRGQHIDNRVIGLNFLRQ